MMTRRIATVGALLFVLLGVPRPSSAGILDFIWEMSGPQMVGAGYGCYFTFKFEAKECRFGTVGLSRLARSRSDGGRTFIALGGSLFGSTGKDSDTQGYDWGEIWLLAFEPGIAVRSTTLRGLGNPDLTHGAGISYELLFGRDIKRFDKFAFTITPIDLAWRHVSVGVKLRLYPHGSTDDEFKPVPRVTQNRPFEATIGATVSYILR